ncbi:exported hypothetical protein [Capnocytophaga canimorsus]|uniref:Lipoprotein n=1 Tax=Capnocytophaga canimorsus TaxID=28188 RepID=A0A0B7IKQ6_9FLAO|nr:hypothetical protein [Capnocytophaga canimorsus]CEN52480.1 exported hypothetical protein [Capnocytophaga canimorsus]
MKTSILKLSCLFAVLFLISCSGSGGGTAVAVAPENRESFTENMYFKSLDPEKEYNFEGVINEVKKKEFKTLIEAIASISSESRYNEILKNHKDNITKVEKITKSKFFVYDHRHIYFTPIDTNVLKGNITKGYVGKIYIPGRSVFELEGLMSLLLPFVRKID